jgi:hypothetical protein
MRVNRILELGAAARRVAPSLSTVAAAGRRPHPSQGPTVAEHPSVRANTGPLSGRRAQPAARQDPVALLPRARRDSDRYPGGICGLFCDVMGRVGRRDDEDRRGHRDHGHTDRDHQQDGALHAPEDAWHRFLVAAAPSRSGRSRSGRTPGWARPGGHLEALMDVAVLTGRPHPPVEVGPSSSPGRGLAHLGGRAARGPVPPTGASSSERLLRLLGSGSAWSPRHATTRPERPRRNR